MNDILDQFRGLILSKTAKDTYIVFVGNIISFFFGIIFAIFAARAIEPSGWGIFSAAGGFMAILFAFSELGLSAGLFKFVSSLWLKNEKRKVSEIAGAILFIRLITAFIFSFLIIIFAGIVADRFYKNGDLTLVYLTAVGLIGSLLMDFQISLLQAKRKWIIASVLTASTNFFRLILFVVVKYFSGASLALLFSVFFLSPFITFLISLFFEKPTLSFPKNFISVFKNVSKFSLWMGVNRSVGSISSRVDSVLLLQLAGSFEAGIVGVARQLSNAVLVLLGSFATVIAPRLASYTGIHLKKYYKKVTYLSWILAAGVLVGIVLVNPIISLLGPKYSLSTVVFRWLLVGLVPFALSTPSVNALIYAFHKPQIIAILSIIQLPLIIIGNILLIPKFGILGPVIVIGFWNLSTLLVAEVKSKWELSAIH